MNITESDSFNSIRVSWININAPNEQAILQFYISHQWASAPIDM